MNNLLLFYRKLRWRLSSYDAFIWFFWLQPYLRPHVVSKKSDLLIEGYPRSGNTFACTAFHVAQPSPVTVASHLHCPGHLKRALRLDIPCMILIRRPLDAISSMVIFYQCKFPIRQAIREYIDFYEAVFMFRQRLFVVSFEEVRSDFGAAIQRFNLRFGTDFLPFDNTEENCQKCFALIDEAFSERYGEVQEGKSLYRITKPVEERSTLKERVMEKLQSDEFRDELHRANNIYNAIVSGAESHE
ncbi:hypothetical protein [Tichowtungia aerotolerans]|uniref:Sulfotransferase n=1 Tax=Tichowtungia aerotolerans TaxID=2697043 RepID=A0A6P1M4Y6_9BACT|nr:hypothetical protein [Tichowtungia aerotolerans]QHI68063.1 hypothetical protein GT409_00875 [Tichowtungia aerotolerans]